jgi:hypothetical protein
MAVKEAAPVDNASDSTTRRLKRKEQNRVA